MVKPKAKRKAGRASVEETKVIHARTTKNLTKIRSTKSTAALAKVECEVNEDLVRVRQLGLEEESDALDAAVADFELPGEENILEIDGAAIAERVQKLLKTTTFEPAHHFWLNLGSREANSAFGSAELGVPYGKVVELAGVEHCGKTLVSNVFMGLSQRDGAAAGYIDLENSRDGAWSTKLGVRWSAVTQFYPKLVAHKKGPPTLQSAEDIFEEAEAAMEMLAKSAQKQFWFVDSIANIVTAKQYDVGVGGASMNSKLDRAMFLSTLLPRWAGLAANYNALIFLSNQLRAKFGYVVGDPDETTGGRALKHACAVRVRGRRVKGGRLRQGKSIIGLAGAFRNVKNKAGGGSVEGGECAFKILWNTPQAHIQFMTIDELKKEMGEKEED